MLAHKSCNSIWPDTHFSREVAKLVTQPLWPSRVPLSNNCSDMMSVGDVAEKDEGRGRKGCVSRSSALKLEAVLAS